VPAPVASTRTVGDVADVADPHVPTGHLRMSSPVLPPAASAHDAELEGTLTAVEARLAALGEALRERDSAGIDLNATELHRALATAIDHFARAARKGSLPPALRLRLASTSGQVAAQRESLARATAALDRAIDVLLPSDNAALYSNHGIGERSSRGGAIVA
jgi:hypothetical protein